MQVAGTATSQILRREKTRPEKQVFQRGEKLAIEMGKVVKKMRDKAPNVLLWLRIFLAAHLAIGPLNLCPAVKAVLLFSFRLVRQTDF